MKMLASLIVIALVAPLTASAAELHHGPHQHGVGQLNLAQEKDEVEIELEVPGADIVGFDHPAASAEDRKAMDVAVTKLKDGARLFLFPAAAGCSLKEAEVEVHGGDKAEHDDGKKKEEQKNEHELERGHSEFHAHYHFRCADIAAASPLDVQLFAFFPSAQKLAAQSISPSGQGAATLTPQNHRFNF